MLIVQCDFDDTITIGNVSAAIREVFAEPGWRAIEAEEAAGRLSVEQSNMRQFALVKASKDEIEDFVLGETAIRYAFDQFVDYCNGEGIRLVIVSSGLDLYIRPAMEQLGFDHLETYSGSAEVTPDGVRVSYTDPHGKPVSSGFKESYVRWLKRDGDTLIYVGDGRSDIVPAGEADFVIARSTLAEHRKSAGLVSYTFDTFDDVGKHVEEVRQQMSA
ncbi:MAG: MtnX-like HAD-IB family phosphatase [Chloroflexi bacterium]|nr:MtnX-like HAD-IB family phosphatase [Chloroflexota bacterium]